MAEWQPPADGILTGDLVNGEAFEGVRLPYLPQRTESYIRLHAGNIAEVEMRLGARPGLEIPASGNGLHVIAHQTSYSTVTYDEFAAFLRFAAHKDLLGGEEAVLTAHRTRELPEDTFREAYARFAKTLVGVGDGAGEDQRLGLETELVALDNPYTDDLSEGMRVRLYYQGAPRTDEQVEIFERAPDGSVAISTVRTDMRGTAVIGVKPGHDYQLDAVVLREPSAALAAETDAVWETLWANLTFSVPAE